MDHLLIPDRGTPPDSDPPQSLQSRLDSFAVRILAACGTFLLLLICTWGLLELRLVTHDQRPYTILYLIPIALGAAFLGVRGGVISALVAVVLARIFLFNDAKHGSALLLSFPRTNEAIEFGALLVGTLTVAFVTGRLRTTLTLLRISGDGVKRANDNLELANSRLAETNSRLEDTNTKLAEANERLVESEEQRRIFHRDVLMAVTGGKLRLVEPSEMPPPDLASGAPLQALPLNEAQDASRLRRTLEKIACDLNMHDDRIFDLCTGATEAATNAIKHGNGGQARIWADSDAVSVEIADRGTGIAPHHLARATLQQGYSTRVSLGMGFHLMLQTSDALALSTTPEGTSVLLRVSTGAPISEEETLLARYVSI